MGVKEQKAKTVVKPQQPNIRDRYKEHIAQVEANQRQIAAGQKK